MCRVRRRHRIWTAARLLGCASALCFVSLGQARAAAPTLPLAFPGIYERTTNEFALANFLKPKPAAGADLNLNLSPLLLQQVNSAKTSPAGATGAGRSPRSPGQFGRLTGSGGALRVDLARPTIYVGLDTIQLEGKPYGQLTYLWVYGAPAKGRTVPLLGLQGVRMTLDSTGRPVIWEVLSDHSGAELFFVSHKLEEAAEAQWGPALPGRRYAIERSCQEAPKVVVARVIADGPEAMGPMVYLQAGTHDVSTLLCRCMPAQASKLLHSGTYALVPLSQGQPDALLNQARLEASPQPAFWPGAGNSAQRLEHCLRLPSSF